MGLISVLSSVKPVLSSIKPSKKFSPFSSLQATSFTLSICFILSFQNVFIHLNFYTFFKFVSLVTIFEMWQDHYRNNPAQFGGLFSFQVPSQDTGLEHSRGRMNCAAAAEHRDSCNNDDGYFHQAHHY